MQLFIKKLVRLGATTLTIYNEEMNDVVKILKYPEGHGLLIKDVNETIQNQAKEQKCVFLSFLSGTIYATLLRNILTGKE